MAQPPAWFERQFSFTFPVEQFPNLCVRLRGTPARLEEMLRGVAPERLRAKPEGKWSAQEHAGHLADMEPFWLLRVDDFLDAERPLTPADLSNRKTHQANHNATPPSDILAEFRKHRLELVTRAAGWDASAFGRSLLHPRLRQPMRLVDHLHFIAEHDDHHLARIWELVGA